MQAFIFQDSAEPMSEGFRNFHLYFAVIGVDEK